MALHPWGPPQFGRTSLLVCTFLNQSNGSLLQVPLQCCKIISAYQINASASKLSPESGVLWRRPEAKSSALLVTFLYDGGQLFAFGRWHFALAAILKMIAPVVADEWEKRRGRSRIEITEPSIDGGITWIGFFDFCSRSITADYDRDSFLPEFSVEMARDNVVV